ncbi:MAG TPA: hypothetical protein DCZ95_15425 [Verrucomicrobia bacterium]|nr:MAG: hypothetical protein A2X46_08135 [Lentisphaerae bacterium GWF2_57_35]HBA85476.1 hypothetical protein [Verrucomicrobiota bacterium]
MGGEQDIVFYCIHCGQKIVVHRDAAGCRVECPTCANKTVIPEKSLPEEPLPPPALEFGEEPAPEAAPPSPNRGTRKIRIPKNYPLGSQENPSKAPFEEPLPTTGKLNSRLILSALGFVFLALGSVYALTSDAIGLCVLLLSLAFACSILCWMRYKTPASAVLTVAAIIALPALVMPMLKRTVQTQDAKLIDSLHPDITTIKPLMESNRAGDAGGGAVKGAPAALADGARNPASLAIARKRTPGVRKDPEAWGESFPAESADVPDSSEELYEEPSGQILDWDDADRPVSSLPLRSVTRMPDLILEPVKVRFPFVVYGDCEHMAYYASGWMGNIDDLEIDECCEDKPHRGRTCMRITYYSSYMWAGISLQDPPNNWGEASGGYNLTGARALTFWVRAQEQGTRAEFKMGLSSHAPYADTARVSSGKVELSTEWKKYSIPLKQRDLSRIVNGFICVFEGNGFPITIYVDDIVFQ